MVKIWKPDTTSWETYTLATFQDFTVVKDLKLTLHQSLKERFPKVKINIESAHPPVDYFSCGTMELISEKLMNILTSESNIQAEFFPVEIIYNEQIYSQHKFFCINILDVVDCFDFQNSTYLIDEEIDDEYIESIDQLVLKPVNENEHQLFYVDRVDFSIICITEFLANKIVMAKCTGIKFVHPSETNWEG
jgi:hypothetical protein